MPRSDRSRLMIIGVAAAALLALTGCSSQAADGVAAKKGASGAAQVAITLSNQGGEDVCGLSAATAPAGPVTFTVGNTGATGVTEVELMSDDKILGEKENVVPGLPKVNFTVTLGGGEYQVYCPGAKKELQKFTVTGKPAPKATGSASALLAVGAKEYAGYVTTELAGLQTSSAALKAAVDSGDLAKAQAAYAAARPFYEHIETDVDGFVLPGHKATDNAGNLDYLLDMRASNLDAAVGWHGFHAIERDLFASGAITDGTKRLAAELVDNVTGLNSLSAKLTFKPEDLANGAAGLLEEVQSGKVQGEEEAYSHTDLADIAANIEGARQAFAYLKPGLKKVDAQLTASIDAKFATVITMMDGYRDAASLGGYRSYTEQLRASDANTISQTVQGLQDPLSRIAEKVATAQ